MYSNIITLYVYVYIYICICIYMYICIWVDGLMGRKVDYLTRSGPGARQIWSLEGLGRSGRPVGRISTNFRQKRSGGFQVMTKKPKKLRSKQVTSTSM